MPPIAWAPRNSEIVEHEVPQLAAFHRGLKLETPPRGADGDLIRSRRLGTDGIQPCAYRTTARISNFRVHRIRRQVDFPGQDTAP
jgi:hypothetical protein